MEREKNKKFPMDIPVGILAQEARDLYNWCQPDKDLLIESGLDWRFAAELPERTDALVKLQSEWVSEYKKRNMQFAEWKAAFAEGLALQKTILYYLRHALHDNPDKSNILKSIRKSRSRLDELQSFKNIFILCEGHKDELLKVGFDFSLVEKARLMGDNLRSLWAKASMYQYDDVKFLNLRNAAYINLKEAVNKVRRHGKFVFIKDNLRFQGYKSDFIVRKNQQHSLKIATKKESKLL
jgi:hypothetical protein